jgi:hypothetical protein
MKYITERDYDFIQNKYHLQSEPFNPMSRFCYHGIECDYSEGLGDDEMRRENRILHDIIAKNVNTQKNTTTAGVQLSIETNPSTTTSATDVMFKDELDPNGPPRKVRRRPSPIKANTPANNKVGDMFDMLTFKDV